MNNITINKPGTGWLLLHLNLFSTRGITCCSVLSLYNKVKVYVILKTFVLKQLFFLFASCPHVWSGNVSVLNNASLSA